MRIGTSRELITPARPMSMGGYGSYFGGRYLGVHDDLYAKAILLDDSTNRIVLITADLLFYDFSLAQRLQDYAYATHGIPQQNLFISYTHTHGGPAVRGYDATGEPSPEYEEFLVDRLCRLVDRVFHNQFDATLSHASIPGDWNINRRKNVDGRIENRPNDYGPRDENIHALLATDSTGTPRAILANYGCHPVTVRDSPYLSAEFPGRIGALLEAEYYGCTALYFQGAGGNARPRVTAHCDHFISRDYSDVHDLAASIVGRTTAAIAAGQFEPLEIRLGAVQFPISLPITPHSRQYLESVATDPHAPAGKRKVAAATAQTYDHTPDTVDLPAGIIRLGDNIYIAYLGGEPCYEIKQLLEPVFSDTTLMFIGYADSTAYIGDDTILDERGYEGYDSAIDFGLKGPFAPGINQRLEKAFRTALDEISAQ